MSAIIIRRQYDPSRLRALRGDRHLKDVAPRIGVTIGMLSHYERGLYPIPEPRLRQLLDIYGAKISDVLPD